MKSYKELLNEWAQNTSRLHEMTNDERSKLQKVLLSMFKDIQEVCENNNLTLMLTGGSCLGAVRHKGFIPWDDDLDVMMPRADYERLISLLQEGVLNEQYEYRYPNGKMESTCCFLKLYKKNTVFGFKDEAYYANGIYIDIFPIDGVPSSKLKKFLISHTANALRLISNCVAEYKYPSYLQKYALEESPELNKLIKKRMVVGCVFSFIDHKTWKLWFDKLVSNEDNSEYLTIPTGRKLYNGEINKYDVFFPPRKCEFAGLIAKIPNDADAYLKNMYGDYMKIPPVSKRERHFIETLKF